jgi:hypothetical protein
MDDMLDAADGDYVNAEAAEGALALADARVAFFDRIIEAVDKWLPCLHRYVRHETA